LPAYGAILLGRRQVAVEGEEREVMLDRDGLEGFLRAPDLRGAGQEDKYVAVWLLAHGCAHGSRDLECERPIIWALRVLGLHFEHAAFGAQSRSAQVVGDRLRAQCRRHHDDTKVGPACPAKTPYERESNVTVKMAFVKLVENDRRRSPKLRIRNESAREYPLGHEADPCRFARLVLEPHRVANRLAHALAALFGYALGRHPRCQPARLENDDVAAAPCHGPHRIE
jgi:hypothetical protein